LVSGGAEEKDGRMGEENGNSAREGRTQLEKEEDKREIVVVGPSPGDAHRSPTVAMVTRERAFLPL
jgi:hypothetical protein